VEERHKYAAQPGAVIEACGCYWLTFEASEADCRGVDDEDEAAKGHKMKIKEIKIQPLRFEVIMAVTMKNVVFWDIKTQFLPHRRHITSPLLSPAC
jgi:hypothetical protein